MSNIPFLDRTTHDTFHLHYVFNSSEPSDNVNPLHVSDQILNTANKWSKKSEFMLFRFFQFRGKSADSTRPRFLCSCFLHALVRPHSVAILARNVSKDEWRNLLCHFKSSLPFPCFSSRSFHLSFFANSRFYCSPPRNNDKNSRINTQKRYIRNEKSGVTVQREGERAKEREKKIDRNDEKAKKTTGRNTKDEGS